MGGKRLDGESTRVGKGDDVFALHSECANTIAVVLGSYNTHRHDAADVDKLLNDTSWLL